VLRIIFDLLTVIALRLRPFGLWPRLLW